MKSMQSGMVSVEPSKKEFTLMAFWWFRFFWQRSISPPVRQADSFNTMMPSHFSPSELRRPFCFFEVQGSRLTRRPFRLHQSLTSVSVLMKSLKKFQGFSRSAKVNSCKFVCDDRKFPAHLLSFSVIMEVQSSWGNGSRKMKGLYRGSFNPKSHFIGCKKKSWFSSFQIRCLVEDKIVHILKICVSDNKL